MEMSFLGGGFCSMRQPQNLENPFSRKQQELHRREDSSHSDNQRRLVQNRNSAFVSAVSRGLRCSDWKSENNTTRTKRGNNARGIGEQATTTLLSEIVGRMLQ